MVEKQQGFVGREAEKEAFRKFIADPAGQAAIVVGQPGFGKTWLMNRLTWEAENRSDFSCKCVSYTITGDDGIKSIFEWMLDDAFSQITPGSFDPSAQRRKQWKAVLDLAKLGGLVDSLRRDPKRPSREQFIERLAVISERLPENGRAIFRIDPHRYLPSGSDQSWGIVIHRLPEKIKLIFAQRPDDVLVNSDSLIDLNHRLVRIPPQMLGILSPTEIYQLMSDLLTGRNWTHTDQSALRDALARYEGHPFAVHAALNLAIDGIAPNELPPDPTGIPALQWKNALKRNHEAASLFKALAVLDCPVDKDLLAQVTAIPFNTIDALLTDAYIGTLIDRQGRTYQIYHALFADYIQRNISTDDARAYHQRSITAYRSLLQKGFPSPLAVTRLPHHVRVVEGDTAFISCFIDECTPLLFRYGRLDVILSFSHQAMELVKQDRITQAVIYNNLGKVYRTRGDLKEAVAMCRKALEIHETLGNREGMANAYCNLGNVSHTCGNLKEAEAMYQKALEIDRELGNRKGMATDYGNLGIVYRTCSDLKEAEAMHQKALEISEELGSREGMANTYCNLGAVYQTRGDLKEAEAMHRKALEIYEMLGSRQGMAANYGNLGNVYRTRGDLKEAEVMFQKALEINKELGSREGMAKDYGNFGIVYGIRGDVKEAEAMLQKALEINKELGSREGMADQYSNLGVLYKQRGEPARAREYWNQSKTLYQQLENPDKANKVQSWIDGLEK